MHTRMRSCRTIVLCNTVIYLLYYFNHRNNILSTTTVACVNAIGQAIPPYVLYNAETLNPEWMKDGPPGTKYAHSENGWIGTTSFEHWFNNHFLYPAGHFYRSWMGTGHIISLIFARKQKNAM